MKDIKEYICNPINEEYNPEMVAAYVMAIPIVYACMHYSAKDSHPDLHIKLKDGSKMFKGDKFFDPIQYIRFMYKKWSTDKKYKSIIDKLSDDEEIMKWIKDNTGKDNRTEWKKLVKSKLSEDELDYLNSITRTAVKNNK